MTFRLLQPTTLSEAFAILTAEPDAALPIAGGTDLLSEIRDGTATPSTLVALDKVADGGLHGITATPDGGMRIGALTTIADIAAHPEIRQNYAAFAEASAGLATPQVRNLGTLGGNLNQRPRCWYYRHPLTVCLKRGGDHCFAVQGVGKYLCVTGGDRCFIVHPSDTAVALTALQASVNIASGGGTRTLPIEQYFTGPNVDLMRENILQTGELLTSITLPSPISEQHSVYLKARERESGDFALVSVAAALTVHRRYNHPGFGGTGRRRSHAVPSHRYRSIFAKPARRFGILRARRLRVHSRRQTAARQRLQNPNGQQPRQPGGGENPAAHQPTPPFVLSLSKDHPDPAEWLHQPNPPFILSPSKDHQEPVAGSTVAPRPSKNPWHPPP